MQKKNYEILRFFRDCARKKGSLRGSKKSDAPLYYYSFTDAYIAMTYMSLSAEEQARFDPMITGFNPADMYAVDHIKRVLLLKGNYERLFDATNKKV